MIDIIVVVVGGFLFVKKIFIGKIYVVEMKIIEMGYLFGEVVVKKLSDDEVE